MNVSTAVTRVKLKLGIMGMASPIKDLDNVIVETILNKITLPVFSKYCPAKDRMIVNLDDLERVEKNESYCCYILPDFKTRELLYVLDVRYDETTMTGLGFYGSGFPLITGNMLGQAMLSNASMNLANQVIPKMTYEYVHPRKLYIYNAYNSYRVIIDLGFVHDKSLCSIPNTAEESFFELFALDVKENLYPTFKQFSQINTAYGNIDLKIDDWSNAESERKDLLSRWDDNFHLDAFKAMYFG